MTKLIAAAAVAGIAGAASAAILPYGVGAVSSGSDGSVPANSGLQMAFFNNADGSIQPPAQAILDNVADFQWNTYVQIGGAPSVPGTEGQVAPGFTLVAPGASIGASIFATWFGDPAITGSVTEAEADGSLFLGRYSGAGDLTGELFVGNLTEDGGATGAGVFAVGGAPIQPAGLSQSYFLEVRVSQASIFGSPVQVNDLYLVAIPAPGAASLLGLAGLAAARRRR